MTRHTGPSKKRSVENALLRLGLQAKAEEVVAELARHGVVVGAGLVRHVRFELLKATGRAQQGRPRHAGNRPFVRFRTTPAPRAHR
jgi:hypothetical protein